MNHDKLAELIALGEGTTLEFKRSGVSGLGQEICAFANSSGGKILLGVTDDGDIVGVSGINRLKSDIQNIARAADPSIRVEIELLASSVLCIKVPSQREKPYSFGGRFYFREGANSQKMSRDEVRNFFGSSPLSVGKLIFERLRGIDQVLPGGSKWRLQTVVCCESLDCAF